MQTSFTQFKDEVLAIINAGNQESLDDLWEEIESIKLSLGQGVSNTRDIVLHMQAPLSSGEQSDTEFFVPYNGHIEQIVMSVGAGSVLTSNLIWTLQVYDAVTDIWSGSQTFEMHASDRFRIVTLNTPIDKKHIRISLGAGDYQRVNGITVVIRVKES